MHRTGGMFMLKKIMLRILSVLTVLSLVFIPAAGAWNLWGAYHGSGDSDSGGRPFYLHLYEDKGDIRRDLTAGYGVHDCLF